MTFLSLLKLCNFSEVLKIIVQLSKVFGLHYCPELHV